MHPSVAWRVTTEGLVAPFVVQTRAKRDRIVGVHGDAIKIAVAAAPEKGKANARVVEFLAGLLGAPRSAVVIRSGHTSHRKQILFTGRTDWPTLAAALGFFGGPTGGEQG
ncbi:MAG: DUF167 domain-containing protein [Planctomycetes bacterium]|nr:DUF167 domain-containing protein [Planctomycetota bacterium]